MERFLSVGTRSGRRYVEYRHRAGEVADRKRRAQVQLVPTTTASAGANYQVTYNSQGEFQFSQVWAVPPSSIPLKVSAVVVSSGTVVGGGGGGAGAITGGDPNFQRNRSGQRAGRFADRRRGICARSRGRHQYFRADHAAQPGILAIASGGRQSGPCGGGGVLPQFSDSEIPRHD